MFLKRISRGGGILPRFVHVLLSEETVRHAAQELLSKFGSQAWGMADVRARAFKTEGFHSFAITWERIRDVVGTVQSEIGGSSRTDSLSDSR